MATLDPTASGDTGSRPTTAQGEPDDPDHPDTALAVALDRLTRLTVGDQSLEHSLEWIAQLAVVAVPGADGAGVTMHESGHPETVCVSDPFVREVDDVQYGLDEGPCITAAAEVRTVVSGRLAAEPRWPRFGPRARELGVLSSVSVPLVMADGEVMGALNVYAHAEDAFTDAAAARAEVFAATAAVSVNNARALMQARRLAEQLTTALHSRATIDQAIGILLSRHGGNPTEAFGTLRRLSQNQNVKLSVVADGIVREAVTRARARRSGG